MIKTIILHMPSLTTFIAVEILASLTLSQPARDAEVGELSRSADKKNGQDTCL